MEAIEQINKPNLFVFGDFSPINDYSDAYWRECFFHTDFDRYKVRIIEGQYQRYESFLFSDISFKHQQLRTLLDLFAINEIKDGDVFVFANAWNYVAVPLSFFRYEYGLDIKMIGFWGNSVFNKTSPMVRRLKMKTDWGYNFEMSLFKTYDLNCFFSEEHQKMFSSRHKSVKEAGVVTGFPFGYLKDEVKQKPKQNLVFTPWPVKDEIQLRVWKGMRGDHHKDLLFIDSWRTHTTREKYKELLKEAKFLFCPKEMDNDPVLIYEAMLYGVVPFLQRKQLFQMLFSDEYLIPEIQMAKKNKYLYMMRHRMMLSDFFTDRIDNYDEWKVKVETDAIEFGQKYYDNQKFLNELKKITGI